MDGVADTPEKMDRYIRTIYNKTNEMDLLINELTLYSKIDTNRIPYNFATISAKDYFGDCAEDLKMELDSKGVEFVYRNLMDEDCKVIVDPEQMWGILSRSSWETMERASRRKSCRMFLTGSTGQTPREILLKEGAASGCRS